ncbi:MAG TPA: chemotaxis protein CheB [Solirubrobacteraceae bacterium]|nr:chemotaxis protein CheB [Solirubrobacteraceae bacterium]
MGTREAGGGDGPGRVVGIGASAGGVDALMRVVRELPPELPAAICIVLHVPSSGRSLLASILGRQTRLPVVDADEDQLLRPGCIYVAPNDRHLILSDGHLRLDRGPKENGVRPAVDVLLRTLAAAYGPRAIAVILSGALGDGSAGAAAVRNAGGLVIVQDPEDATVASMPESALRAVGSADAVLSAEAIGHELARLVEPERVEQDTHVMPVDEPLAETPDRPHGPPSPFTCPECSGPLWELREGEVVRYRCRVGHGYTEDAMVIEQGSAVEAALWSALEALEERAEFLRRVAGRHGANRPRLRDRFNTAAEDALERADLIRTALGTRGDRPHALDLQAEAAE